MPVFTAANNAVSVAPSELIRSALLEIGVIDPTENPLATEAAWGLEKLQRIIDQWNAVDEIVFSHTFQQFAVTPNHSPHTFGPGGDFNVPIRPVKVISASLVLNASGSAVDLPIKVRDDQWWAANPLKSMTGSISTHLYYDAASPLGNCNLWPISTVANPVRLETWNSLAQAIDLDPTHKLGFVQGYWEALVLTLALSLCQSMKIEPSGALIAMQKQAIQIITRNNGGPPRIDTANSGMPSSGRAGRPDFNFLTGLME